MARILGDESGAQAVYASWEVGNPDVPGPNILPGVGNPGVGSYRRNTVGQMLKAAIGGLFQGLQFETWMPFTVNITSRFQGPRRPFAPWSSPFDLVNAGITRFGDNPSADRAFPYPYEIGAVSADMPMLDQYSMAWAWGRNPSGPGVLTPVPIAWQASYPSFQKVSG